ncbi:hypothetical protein TNCT_671271 [Trichonephila clavata]|uniref:Uncharacterized protein n=1 Tax=Trichonephila clavata TaxID=2740835 RepID=A0A8X6KIJ4_TRICU|nr:hypothetical protein TNCT_671271 [Trichonephila clavata]
MSNTPFSQVSLQNLITLLPPRHIEHYSLKPYFNSTKEFSDVHFQTKLYYPVQKANDTSDFERQMALETQSYTLRCSSNL